MDNIQEWLNEAPTVIEENPDGSQYVPIWQVERDLTELDPSWDRQDHKYSFHGIGDMPHLATSISIRIYDDTETRTLVGGSFLSLADYAGNSNIIQTGIAEATKAAVKILGRRFGSELNDRAAIKKPPQPQEKPKMKPDKAIIASYKHNAKTGNHGVVKALQDIYDFTGINLDTDATKG